MGYPKYIIDAARAYRDAHGGDEALFDAYMAGYAIAVRPKTKQVFLNHEQQTLFDKCWNLYGKKGAKAQAMKIWSEISIALLPVIHEHIKAYVVARELKFRKDFERYLKNGEYKNVVFSGNSVLFDPTRFDVTDEYRPKVDGIFQYWDDEKHCLMFNGDIRNLNDGYTDNDRPDGARAKWQMYLWIWNSQDKEWVKQ